MQDRNTVLIVAIVVVVVAGATLVGALLGGGLTNPQASQENAASSTVAAFGQTLQQVSLLAPDASSTMASVYAPYVDPKLLVQWQKDPKSAPGRVVSSPWPDHIVVSSVTPQGSGYIVNGNLVFVSSSGSGSNTPIVVQVAQESGKWMIVAFQQQNQQ